MMWDVQKLQRRHASMRHVLQEIRTAIYRATGALLEVTVECS